MDTKKISLIPAEQEFITKAVIDRIPQAVDAQLRLFDGVIGKVTSLLDQTWITFADRDVWFNTAVCGIFPNLSTFEPSRQNVFFPFVENRFNRSFDGFQGDLMNIMELRASELAAVPRFDHCLLAYRNGSSVMALNPRTGDTYSYNTSDHQDAVCVPSVRFTMKNGLPLKGEAVIPVLLKNRLLPSGLTDEESSGFKDLMELYCADRGYVTADEEGKISFNAQKLTEDISSGKYSGRINGMDFAMDNLISVCRIKADAEFAEELKVKLLNCEMLRADIDPYDSKLLSDPNRGHWDLWDFGMETGVIELPEPVIARNPEKDVCRDGVIAIDFGTKSTVVVFQRSSDHTLPMAIGTGRLADSDKAEHYENPTVMEFVDMAGFLERYTAKGGRPDTLWEQLPISHTAYSDMKLSASKDYYAYFCDLKKWAGDGTVPLRVCDRSGGEYMLPPYMSYEPADFDPIELYAYYIGLYINNMRNGIYLDYYLSFPVTFEISVKEKITEAFKRGIMKALPQPILMNDELMSEFRVDGSVSEPAAYAVCAMEQYGIYPEEGEELYYGIFDFGGGTADFDYGVCRVAEKKKFDYTIENLGAGGDRYLGGENLLELLAVHVFRSNYDRLAENGITFALPARCSEFAGSAMVAARSREAESNMRHLMECLRPVWERTDERRDEFERGVICADLFDKNGNLLPRFELAVSEEELKDIIRDNIADGIDNFFAAMKLAFESSGKAVPENISVMLAGNSCRNPITAEIFNEKFSDAANELGGEVTFTLYPPLGTEKAFALLEEMGRPAFRSSPEYPTGKTGVAFGLIKCRKGGAIQRISASDEEVPFRYFIGTSSRGVFSALESTGAPMKVRGRPDYDVWYPFTEADEDTFEIYYTSRPGAVTGTMPTASVMKKKCRIAAPSEGEYIYIRATGPRTLQYTVGGSELESDSDLQSRLYTIELADS